MKQHVCDRCGAVIVYPDYRNALKKRTYYSKLRFFRVDTVWRERNVDICDKCHEEFIAWFEKPKGVENNA